MTGPDVDPDTGMSRAWVDAWRKGTSGVSPAPRELAMHYHVAHGLAGYGPDVDEATPTFETLADALDYAREELAGDIDIAHEAAHACADAGQYEEAWKEILRMESLELLRANLDPARRNAPLYADDPAAYRALQESQAGMFPVDAYGPAGRLYLWDCEEATCLEELAS